MDEVERSGPTLLRGSFTQTPDLEGVLGRHGEPCYVDEVGRSGPTALRGSFTQDPDLEARRGFWNDMESLLGGRGKKLTWSTLLGGRSGKKRTYGLTRVVYPDPRSRGEKGVLGRHGEPC